MTRSITPLKKRTNNPPPKIHRFFRGEKQRATRSKARRVTHHKEDKTRNTRTCLVITLQCANAEALWAIMDCILFLFVCVFEVNSRAEMCLSWFSIKNPKSYLVFLPWIVKGGAGSVYTLVVALRRRRRRRRRRRVLQSVWCVLIYIYIFISFLISYKQHPSVFSFSFVYFYPSSFLFCCVGYVLF